MGLEDGKMFDPCRFRLGDINQGLRRHRPRWRYDLVG
jgi:hypothetical protein